MNKSGTIFVYLNGGLGNQLFQFATAYQIAGKSRNVVLIENAGGARRVSSGELEISYAIGTQFFHTLPIGKHKRLLSRICNFLLRAGIAVEKSKIGNRLLDVASILARFPLGLILGINVKVVVCRGHGNYRKRNGHRKGNLLIIGYFQSRNNVMASRTFILNALENRHGEKIIMPRSTLHNKDVRPLAIHVRRGDYFLESKIGCLSDSYYLEAYKQAKKKIWFNEVWIFTEEEADITELKLNINDFPLKIFTKKDYDTPTTLLLMSSCKGIIMSNSTFSWWSAFVSENSNKQSRYWPDPWFRDLRQPLNLLDDMGSGVGSIWLN